MGVINSRRGSDEIVKLDKTRKVIIREEGDLNERLKSVRVKGDHFEQEDHSDSENLQKGEFAKMKCEEDSDTVERLKSEKVLMWFKRSMRI